MISSMTSSASFSVRLLRSASFAMTSLIISTRTRASSGGEVAACRPGLDLQKVFEQIHAGCREDGLGMELHPLDRQCAMAKAHDLPLRRLGRDFQTVGQIVALDQ